MLAFSILVLHMLFVVSTSIRILLRDDLAPSSRMAWFMAVILLPIFGSLLYYFFGEVAFGKRKMEHFRDSFSKIKAKNAQALGDADILQSHFDDAHRSAFSYASSINGFFPTKGNEVELMRDGTDARAHMIADIDAARETVDVLYYIWLDDKTGQNMAHALINAAKRGVKCRVMVDGLGSRSLIKSLLWQSMSEAGVKTSVALPINNILKTIIFGRIDLRNHRKITVIDGRITYCGSQNCADENFSPKPKYAPWIDIMLRVSGPVVSQNQLLFLSDWNTQNYGDMDIQINSNKSSKDGVIAQILGFGPTERRGATPQLFTNLIQTAQKYVTITTPYFVPDVTLVSAIRSAAFRGVKVQLILPKHNDSWIVAATSRSYYAELLEAGAEIFEYKDGLLHSKILTIDDSISLLGSSNIDLRSFDLNYENNILMKSDKLTKQIDQRQSEYIEDSAEVTLADVNQWSYLRRIFYNVMATIGPLL